MPAAGPESCTEESSEAVGIANEVTGLLASSSELLVSSVGLLAIGSTMLLSTTLPSSTDSSSCFSGF